MRDLELWHLSEQRSPRQEEIESEGDVIAFYQMEFGVRNSVPFLRALQMGGSAG